MTDRSLRSVAMLLFEGAASTDITGPLECFGLANYLSGRKLYEINTFSADGQVVNAAGSWMGMKPTYGFETLPGHVDTLLVPGGPTTLAAAADPNLLDWLRRRADGVERICSVCMGTFILAASGLTEGKRVATHWLYAEQLARQHPGTLVDADSLFLRSGKIWSSAGMSAGMDLALAIIEEDFGRALAMETARHMVLYLRRAGGQSQFSMHLQAQFADKPDIERIQQWIIDNPAGDLRIETLAQRAAMSTRTMLRMFKMVAGRTFGEFVMDARLRHACNLLETTDAEHKEVARLSGLGTEANMRRAFSTRLGISPSQYRQHFKANAAAPAPSGFRVYVGYDENWLHRSEGKPPPRTTTPKRRQTKGILTAD